MRWIITPIEISLPAARGIVYDRNGYVLARNIASYNLVITPATLPDDEADIERIYRDVSAITGVPVGGPVTTDLVEQCQELWPVRARTRDRGFGGAGRFAGTLYAG